MNPSQGKSKNDLPDDSLVPLTAVLRTEELSLRPTRQPEYEAETRALVSLAQTLADSPRTILQSLAQTILEFLHADSAGVSLLTEDGTRFYWPAIAGQWASHVGGGTPRDFGPCGDVLDADKPLLFSHPERRYTYLQTGDPPIVESLLVPIHVRKKVVGSIWVVSHREDRRFDSEDLRQLLSLGSFASSAYQALENLNTTAQQRDALKQSHTEMDEFQEKLRSINEALLVGSVSQHELTEAAERLNVQLLAEIERRQSIENKLRDLNSTLEQRVIERTFEAERRTSQLQALAVQLTQAENRERRRLAQLLHDHLQQLLVGAKMRLSFLNLDAPTSMDSKHLSVVREALDEAIEASRSLTVELSPPVLFSAGLSAGLPWLARSMREKHDLEVEVEVDKTAKLENQDMEAFLFQAARELLFNIVKHAKVKKARIELHHLGENLIKLVVQDQGEGFDPERNAGMTGHAGTGHPVMGFGLMSIRERLDVLGGKMSILSGPGQGSRISLTLPIRRTTTTATVPLEIPVKIPVVRRPDTGKIRVLVVDDHKLVRQELVRLFVKHKGIEVVGEAIDGTAALEQVAILQPDVVLMDVNMPEMGGIEATRHITDKHPQVRVIGLSMHTAPEVADEMRRAGAVEFLSKDGPTATLITAIHRWGDCASSAGNKES